jgi:hypothetical protein
MLFLVTDNWALCIVSGSSKSEVKKGKIWLRVAQSTTNVRPEAIQLGRAL